MAPKKHVPEGVSSLGEAVRLLREQQGITLRALADKVGVSAPFLSDLEHGRRQMKNYQELADALDVPIEELQAFDSRLPSDLKDWLKDNPKLVGLLKDLQSSGRPVPLEALRSAIRKPR